MGGPNVVSAISLFPPIDGVGRCASRNRRGQPYVERSARRRGRLGDFSIGGAPDTIDFLRTRREPGLASARPILILAAYLRGDVLRIRT